VDTLEMETSELKAYTYKEVKEAKDEIKEVKDAVRLLKEEVNTLKSRPTQASAPFNNNGRPDTI